MLLKEQMFSLDEVKECRGLDGASDAQFSGILFIYPAVCLGPEYNNSRGPLSSHLSVSKKYFNKLSIKGKKLFDTWVDSLRFPDKAGFLYDLRFLPNEPQLIPSGQDAPLSTPSGRRPSAAKVTSS